MRKSANFVVGRQFLGFSVGRAMSIITEKPGFQMGNPGIKQLRSDFRDITYFSH